MSRHAVTASVIAVAREGRTALLAFNEPPHGDPATDPNFQFIAVGRLATFVMGATWRVGKHGRLVGDGAENVLVDGVPPHAMNQDVLAELGIT